MKKYFIVIIVSYFIISCKDKNTQYDTIQNNKKIYQLLFENKIIKKKLVELFEINKSEKKAFKVLLSRRNDFTRITIYQLFYKSEINELPMGVVTYNKNLFLYYCGGEMLFNKHISKNILKKEIFTQNIILKDSITNIKDSRVLQFDVFNNKNLKINLPAISPFDEDDRQIEFK